MKFTPPQRLSWQSIIAPNPISLLIALSISLCIVAIAFNLDRRNSDAATAALKEDVEKTALAMSRRIGWHLESDLKDAEILAHQVFHEANSDPGRIRQLMQMTLDAHQHFSAVVIAPGLAISQVHTAEGRTAAGQPNAFNTEQVSADISSAAANRAPVVVTGSQENHITLIVPVVPEGSAPGTSQDALAVVIDKTALLQASGLLLQGDAARPNLIDITWTNFSLRDLSRPEYLAFLGDDDVDIQKPLRIRLDIPGGQWELAMAPKEGWDVTPPNQSNFRLLLAFGGLAVILPILVATGLIS